MPVLKRELAFHGDRPGENTGDWWHLVLDTDAPGLYVEHTWQHARAHPQPEGAERFGVNDFLTLAPDQPARSALMSALREMFRELSV